MITILKKWLSKIWMVYDVSASLRIITVAGIRFSFTKKQIELPKERKAFYTSLQHVSVQKNRIVLRSSSCGYSGNAKYIAEEIIRRRLPWELVWIVDKENVAQLLSFDPSIRLETHGTDEALVAEASAMIRIDDDFRDSLLRVNGIPKKKEQLFINVWHGSFDIKKHGQEQHNLACDVAKKALNDALQTDYFIAHSAWEADFYKRVFQAKCKDIALLGHPCNDIFFSNNQEIIRKKVFDYIGVSSEEKLLFYAPSLSENRAKRSFNVNFTMIRLALSKRFGGEWRIAVRMHSKGLREGFFPTDIGLIDVSDYPDIQELLVATDALISDYSSCIFDYLFTGKPAFIYTSDLAEYELKRGLYYPITATPFPVAEDNEMLVSNIEHFNAVDYKNKCDLFLREKGCVEDGHAAERMVELIKKLVPLDNQ